MRIGLLRQRVRVKEKAASSQNSYGENNAGYTVKNFECWAAIDDVGSLGGRKLLVAQQILAEGDHLVRMRHRANLNAAKRIETVTGNRIFDVQSLVNIDSRDREVWFRCKETNPVA